MPEPAPDELYSVLKAFQPCLKSIDMRTIAVRSRSDGEWENLVTSIVVSEKAVDEVRSIQEKLPKIGNNQIALFPNAAPFDYSPFNYFEEGRISYGMVLVGTGRIGIGGTTIRTSQFNPLKLKVTSTNKSIRGVWKWVLAAANSNTAPEREGLWAVAQNQSILTKQLGYKNAEDLIRNVLGMEDISHNKDFELTMSNLAQISKVTFNKSTFDVEIEKVSGLKDLQLNVVQERAKGGGSLYPISRETVAIGEDNNHPLGRTYAVKITVKPENLLPFDWLGLELIHRDSGLIMDYFSKKAPLQNVVEPYFKVLDAFCPIGEFREMLLNPEKSPKKPEKRFENAVAWLLSLAGFLTIYLGAEIRVSKKDHLIAFDVLRNEDEIPIGCADIIAYEDNERLLLVDCDIGGLNEQKIQKLVETRDYFKSLCNYEEFKVVPVLFSPKTFGEATMNKPVAIADRTVIEGMLEEIAKGNREYARSKI